MWSGVRRPTILSLLIWPRYQSEHGPRFLRALAQAAYNADLAACNVLRPALSAARGTPQLSDTIGQRIEGNRMRALPHVCDFCGQPGALRQAWLNMGCDLHVSVSC